MAAANVVDEFTYNQFTNKPTMSRYKPYYGFGNPGKALDTLGQCQAVVKWRGKELDTNLVVMRGKHQNLIGRTTAVEFGMVKLNLGPEMVNHVTHKTWPSKDNIVARFPKLFSSKLGCVNDMEVKLEVDESVRPVKQPLRPVAFHLREPVEKELDLQVA